MKMNLDISISMSNSGSTNDETDLHRNRLPGAGLTVVCFFCDILLFRTAVSETRSSLPDDLPSSHRLNSIGVCIVTAMKGDRTVAEHTLVTTLTIQT